MSIATPPGHSGKGHSGYSSDQPMSARGKVILAVIVLGVVAVAGFGLGDDVLASIFGSVLGALNGLSVGFSAVGHLFSRVVPAPIALSGVLGALAGAVGAWLVRVFESRKKLARSLLSSLFSPEIWQGNVIGLLWKLAVGTTVGYAVASGFSSIGIFDADTTDFGSMARIVLGGGSGGEGGGPGGELGWGMVFFAVLAGLLVAGGVIGACAGGIVGAIIGAGFSSIGTNAIIQGAAEGTMFRIFTRYRPKDLRSGRLTYLLVGAGAGAGESMVTGAFVGMVLFIVRFIGIVS